MNTQKLDQKLGQEIDELKKEGRYKPAERVIVGYIPPDGKRGPRYKIKGTQKEFIRLNSNSYLSLSNHPALIKAADQASSMFGVGPGAVRFIDGTFEHHVSLEKRIAEFTGMPAAKIFNSAYTANCGAAFAISDKQTFWIGDELNHNSIIRAMRIVGVQQRNKLIYKHNDMTDLKRCLENVPDYVNRVVVVFDGVFSMRGDFAPIDLILETIRPFEHRFDEGLTTMVDDSHGIGAYGKTGRGTAEHTGAQPDLIVGTFGKAFGVNGGFIASSDTVIEAVRQKADTYIYTNPLSVADCAAAIEAINICDSPEGLARLEHLGERQRQLRQGIDELGMESIPGSHPVVPLLVRDSAKTQKMVAHFFEQGILVVGLAFPVVPVGQEKLRFQINASHTKEDIDYVLNGLSDNKDQSRHN
jgi:glycine C-acetyltransferase